MSPCTLWGALDRYRLVRYDPRAYWYLIGRVLLFSRFVPHATSADIRLSLITVTGKVPGMTDEPIGT